MRVFVGALAGGIGHEASVTVFSPLLGAQVDLPADGRVDLELDPAFEHGILVDAGPVTVRVDGADGDGDDAAAAAQRTPRSRSPGRNWPISSPAFDASRCVPVQHPHASCCWAARRSARSS